MQLVVRANAAAATICASNCPEVVVFRNTTAPNLMLIADAGRAKLVYAPQVFAAVHDRYGDAGIVALVAHALGHALDDALGAAWIDKSWTAEPPSPSHPKWTLRMQAIRAGYTHCGGVAPLDTRSPGSKLK
jgi:hypothetical protein